MSDTTKKPRCLQEILQRVEKGETTAADADFLRQAFARANALIEGLNERVVSLQAARHGVPERLH